MLNKFTIRGGSLLLLGIALNFLGWLIKVKQWKINNHFMLYGWAMIIGVILFGIGFLMLIYRLIRKVERSSILEDRQKNQRKNSNSETSPKS